MTSATPSIPASSNGNWAGSPQETFDSGLRRTVAWYLDNSQWCARVTDGSYLGQRLGHA